jgi:lipoprotein-releasing system permease protein
VNVSLYIARRYFIAKKSTNAITIISWISVLAIAVGTGALIIILSGMNGLTGLVETLYNSFNPDIKITSVNGKAFEADKSLAASLNGIKGIAFVSRNMEDNMLLKFNDKLQIVRVKGVDENYLLTTRFDTLMSEGKFLAPGAKQKQIVLGKGVAYRLGASMNELFTPVTVFCPKRGINGSINPEDAFNEERCYTSGLFALNDDFDFTYVFIDYGTALALLEYPKDWVTSLELSLKNDADADAVKTQIRQALGPAYVVQNKFEQNNLIFKTLQTEKLWTFIILAFVLLIATFNIIGALTMLIIEKRKDITILSALGADVSLIRNIFMIEGLMIVFIGSFAGILLGYMMCWLQKNFGIWRFDEGYIIDYYPVDPHFMDFLAVMATVLGIGFLAAIYPVRLFTRQQLTAERS